MIVSRIELLALTGVSSQTLNCWLQEEWLMPIDKGNEASFSERDVARALLIKDLDDGMGINVAGIDIVLSLIDQLHGLRTNLLDLRDGVRSASGQNIF
jgi:chaperone modulatory protein CbpM